MQKIWSEGLTVERPLNALESGAHVAHVKLVPDKNFGPGLTKSIRADIMVVKECADGIALFKELIDSGGIANLGRIGLNQRMDPRT